MRKRPTPVSVPAPKPLPPAKDRIMEAATDLFNRVGIHVPLEMVVEQAQTNKEAIAKYYGSREELLHAYVARLRGSHGWEEVEAEFPDDPKAQISQWLYGVESLAISGDWSCFQLERAAAFLLPFERSKTLKLIRSIKKQQLAKLRNKCEAAGFRHPEALATRIFLLVEGALICGVTFGEGEDGPSAELCRMAQFLMAKHDTQAKAT